MSTSPTHERHRAHQRRTPTPSHHSAFARPTAVCSGELRRRSGLLIVGRWTSPASTRPARWCAMRAGDTRTSASRSPRQRRRPRPGIPRWRARLVVAVPPSAPGATGRPGRVRHGAGPWRPGARRHPHPRRRGDPYQGVRRPTPVLDHASVAGPARSGTPVGDSSTSGGGGSFRTLVGLCAGRASGSTTLITPVRATLRANRTRLPDP
jgi:hypothetical protein